MPGASLRRKEAGMAKHIFVTGGVVSSLGKGITAASLGQLLKARGYKVTMQKMDPYLNVDHGTMSPFQHGEVFVTEDGHEGDLDLGHYERFIDENLSRESNFTQGSIYQTLIARERLRRLPRRHRAGHPARDRGHQGADPPRGRASPAPTLSSRKSAAPSATSRACPSSRRRASSRRRWGRATCCSST